MNLYQILVKGELVMGDLHSIFSKRVFTSPPSEEEINEQLDRCCGKEDSEKPGLYDISRETAKTTILELDLIDNKN